VCCRLQVVPSGESYGGNLPAESNGSLLLGMWRDSLHVTCGLTACTPGSAPGPTLGDEYGKTLPFTLLYSVCWWQGQLHRFASACMRRLGRVIERQTLVFPTPDEIEHSRVRVCVSARFLNKAGVQRELLDTVRTRKLACRLSLKRRLQR